MNLFHYEILDTLKTCLGESTNLKQIRNSQDRKVTELLWGSHHFIKSLKICDDFFELVTSSSRLSSWPTYIHLKNYEHVTLATLGTRAHLAQLRDIFGRTDCISDTDFIAGLPFYIDKVIENEKKSYEPKQKYT